MNEELSNILEQALQYASPLPVTSSTENMAGDSQEATIESGLLHQHACSSTFEDMCDISIDAYDADSDSLSNAHQNTQSFSKEEDFPNYCHSNQGNKFYQIEFENQSIESLDISKNKSFVSRDKEFCQFEIQNTGETLDLDFTQMEPVTSLTEMHPDSTSGALNDINDIADACLRFENETEPSVHSTVSIGTDDVKSKVKKRRRRERNPDPPQPTILPPCDICNEKSSGYHYGANTCEACKGFYRRTLKKKEVDYKCKCTPDEKEAWERGPLKNGCPACRYEKCLAVGMSKNAIKIGRYTLNHKTRNIKKIKSIETIDTLITTFTETMSDSSPTPTSGSDEVVTSSPSTVDLSELSIDSSSTSGDSFQPINIQTCTPKGKRNPGISLKEIDYIVKTLTEAHKTLIVDDRVNISAESIKKKQTEYLEKYRVKTELFGSMRNITKDEFKSFYSATGIDIDGRLERVDNAFKYCEKKIAMVVAFAKAIPEFNELCLDDQANLIKASRVETGLICIYKNSMRNLDMDRRVVTLPWGAPLHLDELGKIFPIEHLKARYQFAKQLADLNLSDQEECILRAILTLFTDRCKLEEPEKIDALQEKMVMCLQHLINIRPGGPGTLLYKIFSIITNLRELTDKEMEFAKTLLVEWPMLNLNGYHLVREFIG